MNAEKAALAETHNPACRSLPGVVAAISYFRVLIRASPRGGEGFGLLQDGSDGGLFEFGWISSDASHGVKSWASVAQISRKSIFSKRPSVGSVMSCASPIH
jgi:hypothetical protein